MCFNCSFLDFDNLKFDDLNYILIGLISFYFLSDIIFNFITFFVVFSIVYIMYLMFNKANNDFKFINLTEQIKVDFNFEDLHNKFKKDLDEFINNEKKNSEQKSEI